MAVAEGDEAKPDDRRANGGVGDLVKELPEMNAVFSAYFPKDPPARTTFQAAGLVGGARVEIEAIATV